MIDPFENQKPVIATAPFDVIPHRFIVVEGIDGAGTTTASKRLVEHFTAGGVKALWTREPTDGPIGKLIRQMLRCEVEHPGPRAMATLFTADRIEHCAQVIFDNVVQGTIVVCDRYYYSTFVYQDMQSLMRNAEWFRSMTEPVTFTPDLTLVFDVDPDVAKVRREQRGGKKELFDRDASQRRFASGYASIDEHFPNDWIVHVDANQPVDDVFRDVLAAVWRLPPDGHPNHKHRISKIARALL